MENKVLKSNCLGCNCEIDYYQSHTHKNGKKYYSKIARKYCSKGCGNKQKNNQQLKTHECKYCQNSFIGYSYSHSKYCSRQCKDSDSKNIIRKPYKQYIRTKDIKYKDRICVRCNSVTKGRKYCKECAVVAIKEQDSARLKIVNDKKREVGNFIKRILIHMSGGCCQKCGYNKNIRCLVFHHRDFSKKNIELHVYSIANNEINSVIEEHSKCDLLCHNCHYDLHNLERNKIALNSNKKSQRNKYIKRKLEYIEKCGGECIKCNKVFDINNSQSATFHHREDKKFELNCLAFLNRSDEEIETEGEKCDLMCVNCHMELHYPIESI